MAKNSELYEVLQNSALLLSKNLEQRNAALDALLKVDANSAADFRAAVVQHTDFWAECHQSLMEAELDRGIGLLKAIPLKGYFESELFLDENSQAHPFLLIQQAAAEQRIKLGLQSVENEVLVDILKYNQDECRAYLAKKPLVFGDLTAMHGWGPDKVPAQVVPAPVPAPVVIPSNESRTVLTNDAIIRIQQEASNMLLLKAIKSSKNQEHLTALDKATNVEEAKKAAKDLGLNAEFIGYPLTDSVKKAILDTLLPLQQSAAKANYLSFVKEISEQELLAYKGVLENDSLDYFKNNLPEPYKSKLEEAEIKEMKAAVGTRYLLALLPTLTIGKDALLAAINASEIKEFQNCLKAIPDIGDHQYVEKDFSESEIHSMKLSLLQHHMDYQNTPDCLEKLIDLDKAEPLPAFQAAVQRDLGITDTKWIKSEDMGSIKQEARIKAFTLLVNQTSSLGAGAHSELLNAFKQSKPAKQRELLAMKPEELRNVLQAKELHQVEYYFGRDSNSCAQVMAENQRLSLLKRIHNSEIAKILANFKPSISLDEQKVVAINGLFVQIINPGTINQVDLENLNNYTKLIKDLKAIVAPTVTDAAFQVEQAAADSIIAQQKHNTELLKRYYSADSSPTSKEICGLFLGLNKSESMSVDQANEHLNNLDSDFLKEIKRDLNDISAVAKNTEIKKALSHDDASQVKKEIDSLSGKFDALCKARDALTVSAEKLKPLATLTDVHLMCPAFQGKARSESAQMLLYYQNLSEQCDLVTDELRRTKVALEGYLSSIPAPFDIKEKSNKKQLQELSFNILDELEEVEQALSFYEHIQNKLQGDKGVLKSIERAASGKNKYVYQADNVTSYVKDKKETTTVKPKDVPLARVDNGVRGAELPFVLGENQSKNDSRFFDFDKPSTLKPSMSYKGSFTEQTSVSKDQIQTGSVTITSFPKWTEKTPPTPDQRKELQKAQIEFSLTVAVQTLAGRDGKPSKTHPIVLEGKDPEVVRSYYAAFIILGVDKKAINVVSSAFNPKVEPKKFMVFSQKIAEINEFKKEDHGAFVAKSKEHLKQLMDIKQDQKGTRKAINTGVVKATQTFKKENAEIIREAKDKLKKEGPAPSNSPKIK